MVAAAIILIYAFFAVTEIISLKKTKKKKEMIVFSILISVAFIISMLMVFGVKLPSIDRFVGNIITSITKE